MHHGGTAQGPETRDEVQTEDAGSTENSLYADRRKENCDALGEGQEALAAESWGWRRLAGAEAGGLARLEEGKGAQRT